MKVSANRVRPWIAGFFITGCCASFAIETHFTLDLEARGFTQNTSPPDHFDHHIAAGLEAEIQSGFNDGNTIFTFTPFARWDDPDSARRHTDIRELNVIHTVHRWDFLAGIGKVFWGVTESAHLVDIVNQTDLLEGFDGEDKLGQPMLRASRALDRDTLTFLVLPGFRERKFLSANNPLSLPFEVESESQYESAQGDDHIDYAFRFSGYRGIVDYGISWFHGTSREPDFIPAPTAGRLIAFYPQIDQFGIDLQITDAAWLWKLEAIRRVFDKDDFNAVVAGLEYTIYGLADGLFDLGLLAEYHHDSRNHPSATPFQNDLFLATRLEFTDAESSEILAGGFFDLDDRTASFRVEANRRIFTDARIGLEAQFFSHVAPDNIGFALRNGDFILLSLTLFF